MDCPTCHGNGFVKSDETPSGGRFLLGCTACNGKGEIDASHDTKTEKRQGARKNTRRRKGKSDDSGES